MSLEYLEKTSIQRMEIDLINACTLQCSICSRQSSLSKKVIAGKKIEIKRVMQLIDELSGLKVIDLVGSFSEPTLYPQLLDLVAFIKKQNIQICIGTNGNLQKHNFWQRLSGLLGEKDIIRFGIDGSTQGLYGHYRIGGKLQAVLDNHAIVKESSTVITILQNIIFQHNQSDKEQVKKLFLKEKFDYLEFTDSDEPEQKGGFDTLPRPVDTLRDRYIKNSKKIKRAVDTSIDCQSLSFSQVYLTHEGVLLPCDDVESLFLTADYGPGKLPDIYSNSIQECLDFLNLIIKKRKFSSSCIYACSKSSLQIKLDYPVLQCGKDLNLRVLKHYRGTIR